MGKGRNGTSNRNRKSTGTNISKLIQKCFSFRVLGSSGLGQLNKNCEDKSDGDGYGHGAGDDRVLVLELRIQLSSLCRQA